MSRAARDDPGRPTGARARSDQARAARRAVHLDAVGSPDLASVLVDGDYRHPAQLADRPDAGVLLLKPGILLDEPAMAELAARVAECGYRVVAARVVPSGRVKADGLLRRHYRDHWAVATEGVLVDEDRRALLARYEAAGLRRRVGRSPADLDVVPALALAARLGIPPGRIGDWADAAAGRYGVDSGHVLACNEVGELADVQLLVDLDELAPLDPRGPLPATPLFVLNPQLPLLARWWEDADDPTFAALLRAAVATPLPWREMRASFLGTGPPDRWPDGSLRGDIYHGVSDLRYRPGVEMGAARNGVHLSNGALETWREAAVWLGSDPGTSALGRALVDAGLDPAVVADAVLVDDGVEGVHPLAAVTEHLDVADTVARLVGRPLLDAAGRPAIRRRVIGQTGSSWNPGSR